MSLIRMSTRNPAALLAAAVLVLTFGIIAVVELPIQMLPNLEYAEINVSTSWRSSGSAAQTKRQYVQETRLGPGSDISGCRAQDLDGLKEAFRFQIRSRRRSVLKSCEHVMRWNRRK